MNCENMIIQTTYNFIKLFVSLKLKLTSGVLKLLIALSTVGGKDFYFNHFIVHKYGGVYYSYKKCMEFFISINYCKLKQVNMFLKGLITIQNTTQK